MKRSLLVLLVLLLTLGALGGAGYLTTAMLDQQSTAKTATPDVVAVQLASQVTIVCPSYMTYADQTRLEAGTQFVGCDFLYVERETGIDALTLYALAVHESGWHGNYWSKTYNNVMSFGISDTNPDRTHYATKTANVLATARYLKKEYLTAGGRYYHAGQTLWCINYYYCPNTRMSYAWADGVNSVLKELAAKLTIEQRMRRWCVNTGLFTLPVTWDYTHETIGMSLYKINNAAVVAGR